MFDWTHFLERNNIPFSSHHVTKGSQVAIHCPFCGPEDESQHLSISLKGRGWRCWRRPKSHVGKSPTKLIAALLNCSYDQAAAIAGTSIHLPQDFMGHVNRALSPPPQKSSRELELPSSFKPFGTYLPSERPFRRYLRGRDFTVREIDHYLTRDFDMHYCTQGPFRGRIVFPVYNDGELVTWTGRSIYADAFLRYMTLTSDEEKARDQLLTPAAGPITDFLLWYDDLLHVDADTICLCEGPFDGLKVRLLGEPHGVTATCLFTMDMSERQLDLLHELLPRFRRRYLILDKGTLPTALRLQGMLSGLGVRVHQLPKKLKDPGELAEFAELGIGS